MYDFDLQMRFLRSATDAWCELGQASIAAFREMPKPGSGASCGFQRPAFGWASTPTDAAAGYDAMMKAWSWWFSAATQAAGAPDFWRQSRPAATAHGPFGAQFFDWPASPWGMGSGGMGFGFAPNGFLSGANAGGWPAMWALPWLRAMSPWTYSPMVAMMMSAGVPYSVAAPTARASASAIDAADAAQQQWQKFFAAYRSDGGFAVAQIR